LKQVIIRPIISEKSLSRIASSQYTFEVDFKSNKYEIRDAIKKEFNVKVLSVKTVMRKGKVKQVGKKRQEKTYAKRKFAIVEIPKDQKISAFNQ
jgi:large subunit ribosomal protein L23